MITQKQEKMRLNVNSHKTAQNAQKNNDFGISGGTSGGVNNIIDNIVGKNQKINNKYSVFNESVTDINNIANQIFNHTGMVTNNFTGDQLSHRNIINRVNTYLERFPELDYLVDMISSSIIYASHSNTKKIQFALNGEQKIITPIDSTASDVTSTTNSPNIKITRVGDNDYQKEETEDITTQYDNLNMDVANLFKRNNIKLSLYQITNSMTKYGCGIFYVDDHRKWQDVSFYSLDEVTFGLCENTANDTAILSHNAILNGLNGTGSEMFTTTNNDEIKQFKDKEVVIRVIEDNKILESSNLYFISEKASFGRSEVIKIIHYLKVIELLELSLLIERISKSKTLHVQKLDMSKIEEEDIAPTMMLYRNLMQNRVSLNYNEDTNNMQMDILKNLVDNNVLVPTEDKNLDITSLRSEFKPVMEDISYYQDKIYLSMGIPLHYRKMTDSKAYINANMITMHDNVYAMKIRHYQLIINNLLTFWVENQLNENYKDLTIKYCNVNIPEFIPISERRETDLDKAGKFANMFSQLEQMLGIKVKQDFVLNKLFPNDIISDIVDLKEEEEVDENITNMDVSETEDDILSLFESGSSFINNKKDNPNLFSVKRKKGFDIVKYKLKLNIDW